MQPAIEYGTYGANALYVCGYLDNIFDTSLQEPGEKCGLRGEVLRQVVWRNVNVYNLHSFESRCVNFSPVLPYHLDLPQLPL